MSNLPLWAACGVAAVGVACAGYLTVANGDLRAEADEAKNEVRDNFPAQLFLPVDRRDVLRLVSEIDAIADCAEGNHLEKRKEVIVWVANSNKPQ